MTDRKGYTWEQVERNPLFRLSNSFQRSKGQAYTKGRFNISLERMAEMKGIDTTGLTATQLQFRLDNVEHDVARRDLNGAIRDYTHLQDRKRLTKELERNAELERKANLKMDKEK